MHSDIFIAILAGGQGTRFWPVSRKKFPKQFLSISDSGESLIQATARRVSPIVSSENLFVVSNVVHQELLNKDLPGVKTLCEPEAKNTAAALGFAAIYARKQNPEAVLISLPADHAVKDEQVLCSVLSAAAEHARTHDDLVTIGIEPSSPNTAYGYIKRGESLGEDCFKVGAFVEKPDLEKAKTYLESGEYYWNSGMFVWRAEVLLQAIAEHMPALSAGLALIDEALGTENEESIISQVFSGLESISIDYGVMEYAKNCAVIAASDFGWNDVGSWDAWAEHFPLDEKGNMAQGDAMLIDSEDCVVYSEHRLTAVLGAKDLVVIDSGDALLVCPRDRVQDVKNIVEELRAKQKFELT